MATSTHSSARWAFIAILAILVTLGATPRATAVPCCPTYTVTVGPGVPAACFPMTVTTVWTGGTSGTMVFAGPGMTMTLGLGVPPFCWQHPLVGLIINGTAFPPPPPACWTAVTGCGPRTVCYVTGPTGCLSFAIN